MHIFTFYYSNPQNLQYIELSFHDKTKALLTYIFCCISECANASCSDKTYWVGGHQINQPGDTPIDNRVFKWVNEKTVISNECWHDEEANDRQHQNEHCVQYVNWLSAGAGYQLTVRACHFTYCYVCQS